MTRLGTELLVASGQSAPGNATAEVAGAGSGNVYGLGYVAGLSGETSAIQDPTELPAGYDSGTQLSVTFDISGAEFEHIRNGAASWQQWGDINVRSGLDVDSVTWDDVAPLGVTVYDTVLGDYDSNTLPTLTNFTAYFRDYTSPAVPPDNGDYVVRCNPVTGGPGSPSGTTDKTFQLRYVPDAGGFNPSPFLGFEYDIRVKKIAYPGWTTVYEFECHDSTSYNNNIGNSIFSGPNTTFTWYVRYRLRAEYNGGSPGSWTNYGAVNWSDPRPDI